MREHDLRVAVVIPALDEERSLPFVLRDLPPGLRVVVVDNGSRDATAERAREGGAEVVHEPRRGYGQACLSGLAHLRADPPDVVVFLDADYSDHPEELSALLAPIARGDADLVIGTRTQGTAKRGAMLPQQRFGTWLACALVQVLYGKRYTDLGPFRAIRWSSLESLRMGDTTWGWTVEMQIKAVRKGLRTAEVPVSYRPRIGDSKISGTLSGTVRAGYKILFTVFRHARPGKGTRTAPRTAGPRRHARSRT